MGPEGGSHRTQPTGEVPSFISDDLFSYTLLAMNIFVFLLVGIMFSYQQVKIRQIYAVILTIQAIHTTHVTGLEFLVLRSTTHPGIQVTQGIFQGQLFLKFSNDY